MSICKTFLLMPIPANPRYSVIIPIFLNESILLLCISVFLFDLEGTGEPLVAELANLY